MKGKFDAYVLWPLAKRVQNWIVDRSNARDFTVFMFMSSLGVRSTWTEQGEDQKITNGLSLIFIALI